MPAYPWLYDSKLSTNLTIKKIAAMKTLGAPYTVEQVENAELNLASQAKAVAKNLISQGVKEEANLEKLEIVALVAYLQRLGTDIKGTTSVNEVKQ